MWMMPPFIVIFLETPVITSRLHHFYTRKTKKQQKAESITGLAVHYQTKKFGHFPTTANQHDALYTVFCQCSLDAPVVHSR